MRARLIASILVLGIVPRCSSVSWAEESATLSADAKVAPATTDDDGFLAHPVESPFQAGKTLIRVLLPNPLSADRRYPVVYVLPVENHLGKLYGDGLAEVKKLELHKKHQALFVAPTFSHTPWFADHATDPAIRQESYFLQVVVPYIDKTYPVVAEAKGRLLLGFSKSGWGAWSLLVRHPETFGRAAAWDSPIRMPNVDKYGTEAIFGTQENFEKYRLTDALRKQASALGEDKRLILMGFTPSPHDPVKTHELLDELKIPHEYQNGPPRKHDWHSGWVAEAVELLLRESR